jgi:hypothetical protein
MLKRVDVREARAAVKGRKGRASGCFARPLFFEA